MIESYAIRNGILTASSVRVQRARDNNEVPALIFGSGLTALGVLRSLGRAGIATFSACRTDDLATKSRWFQAAPTLRGKVPAPGELPEYLRGLTLSKAVLFPCSDDWTRAIAELPDDLKQQYPVSISGPQTIETMTNKWAFAEMLERENVPRPKTTIVRSMDQLTALPDELFQDAFLKPLDSQAFSLQTGTKAFQLEGRAHALRIMTEMTRKAHDPFPILLQEYIPGLANSYFLVDGFVDRDGCTLAWIARRRHRMYPAPFGNSTFSETIPIGQVRSAVESLERIWSATKYRGIFDAEFKFDYRDGQFKIVEINARPWWFVEFATRCGVDLCKMAYQDALGLVVEPIRSYAAARRCVYLLYDFPAHCTEDPGFLGYLRWIASLKGCGEIVFCLDDLRPAISLSTRVSRKVLGNVFRRLRWPVVTREPEQQLSLDRRRSQL